MSNIENGKYILGLDISTTTVGISLFEDCGEHGKIKMLTHATPKPKPKPKDKTVNFHKKANIVKSELEKFKDIGIYKVIIEEPLLRSNNVHTVGTLLRFNSIISDWVYNNLNVTPEYVSVHDSRTHAYPNIVQKRKYDKKGNLVPKAKYDKAKPVLFGDYKFDVDKKQVIWEQVSALEPNFEWIYNRNNNLSKENFDMADAYTIVIGKMKMDGLWK